MKVLKSIFKFFIRVLIFISLFYVSFLIAPYLLTSQTYNEGQEVSTLFPIAQKVNKDYSVIKWEEYTKQDEVDLVEEELITKLINNERIEIEKSKDGLVNLTYYADDYTFWSGYYIINGKVQPVYFRFVGAFIAMPVFGAIGIIYLLGRLILRKYMARKRNKGMQPAKYKT